PLSRRPPRPPRFPYTTLFRSPALGLPPPPSEANTVAVVLEWMLAVLANQLKAAVHPWLEAPLRINLTGPGGGSWTVQPDGAVTTDRKSTRLNSSHVKISYAVF